VIDTTHWQRLEQATPEHVCRRSGAAWVEEQGAYLLRVLSGELLVSPGRRQVAWADPRPQQKPPGFHHWLLSVVYLLGAREIPLSGEWAPCRKLPYGEFFFRGPHRLPTDPVARAFGTDGRRFMEAAWKLGGTRSDFGDYAAALPVLPRVPLLYVLWQQDEEFPARASILFDTTIAEHLLVDAVLAACEVATRALLAAGGA